MKRHNRSVSRQRMLPLRAAGDPRLTAFLDCKAVVSNWVITLINRKYGILA